MLLLLLYVVFYWRLSRRRDVERQRMCLKLAEILERKTQEHESELRDKERLAR